MLAALDFTGRQVLLECNGNRATGQPAPPAWSDHRCLFGRLAPRLQALTREPGNNRPPARLVHLDKSR
jgi:hypothetical protein